MFLELGALIFPVKTWKMMHKTIPTDQYVKQKDSCGLMWIFTPLECSIVLELQTALLQALESGPFIT